MKRLLFFVVIASLLLTPAAQAAPKKISVKPMQLVTTVGSPEEVSGVVVSGKSLIVFGSKASKAYVRAVDTTGQELWNLYLDQSPVSIATAAAVDQSGDIWIAGGSVLPTDSVEPTPSLNPINPDDVSVPTFGTFGNLQVLNIWKISEAGILVFVNALPVSSALLPTSISVDKNGASIVGIIGTEKGSAGFFVNTNTTGSFGKILQIGLVSTTADSVVRQGDGSFIVVGSSSESLAGKKVAGVTDGVLIKISKTLKIASVVRSSAAKGKRIWNSASSTLLLGGEVITGGKSETAITKFSPKFVPTWTYRFPSTGPAVTTGSTNAAFIVTGATAQLNWKSKTPTPLLLTFDSKGKITAADRGPVGQNEVLAVMLSKELGVLMVTSSAEAVSIFTHIPR